LVAVRAYMYKKLNRTCSNGQKNKSDDFLVFSWLIVGLEV